MSISDLYNGDAHPPQSDGDRVRAYQTFEVTDGKLGVGTMGYVYFCRFSTTHPARESAPSFDRRGISLQFEHYDLSIALLLEDNALNIISSRLTLPMEQKIERSVNGLGRAVSFCAIFVPYPKCFWEMLITIALFQFFILTLAKNTAGK